MGPLVGGWGAMKDRDGLNGQFSIADGETYNFPVEITEARYGIRVRQYSLHTEEGGFGQYQGGKGNYLDYEICCDEAFFTGSFGRSKFPPWGVDGGHQGSSNYVEILRGGERSDPPEIHSKPARLRLAKGDVVRMVTASGGGWGAPEKRDPEAVRQDLKNGFITQEQAEQHYRFAT